MITIDNNYAPQGWQCPICKRVYSPTTMMCMYCGNSELVTTTGDVQPIVNMPNIIDGTPNNIMVNYCNKEQNNGETKVL